MPDLMWRTAKHEGVGNVVLEQVPIPRTGPQRGRGPHPGQSH